MNINTKTDGIKKYIIPDEKRDEYFKFVDTFKTNVKNVTDENWNTYNDPVAIINTSEFTFYQTLAIRLFMSRIGANTLN